MGLGLNFLRKTSGALFIKIGPIKQRNEIFEIRSPYLPVDNGYLAIYRLIHGVAFVDVGSLTEGFRDIALDTFRWSTGAGLRLHTPVGPVRLEYGYQLQDNPPLDRGQIHFSLGFPF